MVHACMFGSSHKLISDSVLFQFFIHTVQIVQQAKARRMRAIFICHTLVSVAGSGQALNPMAILDGVNDIISVENDAPTTLQAVAALDHAEPVSSPSSLRWEHCKFHRHITMLSLASTERVSLSVDNVAEKPGKRVDTFYPLDCVEDDMLAHEGTVVDKKHAYNLRTGGTVINFTTSSSTNVTVLHYSAIVPKKHQKAMTPRICFNFCRHMDDMYFFGIKGGRDCYCAPFYQPRPDDTSECDATCEGDSTLSCGGQSKSSIFEMHACADTSHVLQEVEKRMKTYLFGSPASPLPQLKLGLR